MGLSIISHFIWLYGSKVLSPEPEANTHPCAQINLKCLGMHSVLILTWWSPSAPSVFETNTTAFWTLQYISKKKSRTLVTFRNTFQQVWRCCNLVQGLSQSESGALLNCFEVIFLWTLKTPDLVIHWDSKLVFFSWALEFLAQDSKESRWVLINMHIDSFKSVWWMKKSNEITNRQWNGHQLIDWLVAETSILRNKANVAFRRCQIKIWHYITHLT